MPLIKSISGIRGTLGGRVNETLTPIDIVKYTAAYGTWLKSQIPHKDKVIVGRDARISGLMVSDLVIATLVGLGIDVVDLELSTTPTVEMAISLEKAGGGIIITASHNPMNWNALKLLNAKGEFITEKEGNKVLSLANKNLFKFAQTENLGKVTKNEVYIKKHIETILDIPLVDLSAITYKKFRIVIDCVNSTGALCLPPLLKSLGVAEIKKIHCIPNGIFSHNPEPLPKHIHEISSIVRKENFDLGIVVDPDVDRLAFVCENGIPFGEEYTLVAIADYVLKHHPKGNTVSNLSSTQALKEVTEKYGGYYEASAVGEVNVVAKMKEVNAVIGGEGNGGVIYPKLHYGRDALVGIALFLSHLAKYGKSISTLRASYPSYFISKNKINLSNSIDLNHILKEIQKKYCQYPINTIDGVKIKLKKEWIHLRKSNTEPIIRIYAESTSMIAAETLTNKIKSEIKRIVSNE